MTYQPGIPLPGDLLSVSQNDIKNNFGKADTSFGINHYTFSDASINNGKHKFLTIPTIANYAAIVPAPAAGEGVIYTKSSTGSQLFYTPDNSSNEYQMTRTIAASFGLFSNNTNNYNGVGAQFTGGWIFLSGGLLLQYGQVNSPGTSGSVTFPVAFSAAPYQVMLQLQKNTANESATVNPAAISTGFNYLTTSSGAGTVLYWMALGK